MQPVKTVSRKNNHIVIGGAMITLLIMLSIFAPLLTSGDPLAQNLGAALRSPGGGSIFGTDSLGRDIFTRVTYGSRVSLGVGTSVLALSILLGTIVGTLAAYCGGVVDAALMRTADVLMSFPPLVMAMIVMAFAGPGLVNLICVLVLIRWPMFARLVRGQVLSTKSMAYVDAARVCGSGPVKTVLQHILPNCFSPVIVYGAMSLGTIIIDESALSFLGLGIQPPAPSWGVMLADAKNYISIAPWMLIFPGLFIMVTVLGFNILGDGLGQVLSPEQHSRKVAAFIHDKNRRVDGVHANFKG